MNAEKSYRVYEVFPNTKNDLIQINRRTRQQKKKKISKFDWKAAKLKVTATTSDFFFLFPCLDPSFSVRV
jgi:hypothetical protein